MKVILTGVVFLLLSFNSLASADKENISKEILAPILEIVKSGEIYKGSLPAYNEFRKSKGKTPLTFSDLKPLFDKTAELSAGSYVKFFAEEFNDEELNFLRRLYSTDVGVEIFQAITKSLTTGKASKPNMSQFNKAQINSFNKVAKQNVNLAQGVSTRISNVNVKVQQYVSTEMQKFPELKALIMQ
jgi:hypothetical protein